MLKFGVICVIILICSIAATYAAMGRGPCGSGGWRETMGLVILGWGAGVWDIKMWKPEC